MSSDPTATARERMAQAEAATTEVVSVENLRVRYGDTVAVDGVSLSIRQGRDLRHPWPKRRRKDDDGRVYRRAART